MVTYTSSSVKDTEDIAKKIMDSIPEGKNVLCLFGDLGSGKTELTKGIAKALEIRDFKVKSPTFTFIREYKYTKGTIFHIDLYRLEGKDDLLLEQIEEMINQKGAIVVIEWAEKIKDDLPDNRLDVCFEYIDPTSRKITVF